MNPHALPSQSICRHAPNASLPPRVADVNTGRSNRATRPRESPRSVHLPCATGASPYPWRWWRAPMQTAPNLSP